jgi:6-phosphogluconolactonase
MSISKSQIRVFHSQPELVDAAAAEIARTITAAIGARGRCACVLAGGHTPRDVYVRLGSTAHSTIDWEHVDLFWGDERTVPPDHADSNFGMARAALLDHVTIPDANVHRIRGEIDPRASASEYSQAIDDTLGSTRPNFDLILLGIGTDGHTASLFPGTAAISETKDSVTAVYVPALDTWRVTLTLPAINAARRVLFLVTGQSKADILRRILSPEAPVKHLPASLVRPIAGEVTWMLDRDAASLLPDSSG